MKKLKGHWQLILITAIVFALWRTDIVFPLKILVIFLHEFSHALAAWLTGGSVLEISLSSQEGGFAVTRGGSRFAISTAGYLGSLLIGVSLFFIALKTNLDRAVLGLFGGIMLLVTLIYIRDLFPILFCTVTGIAMILTAWFLNRTINDLVLRVIGLSSVFYVPYDIFSDTIARPYLRSDAYNMAETFGGTTMLWGGLWLIISLVVIAVCIRFTVRHDTNI